MAKKKWIIPALTLLIAFLLIPQPGNAKEKKSSNNKLPSAPDTGSPQEEFAAGGTRDNQPKNALCGVDNERIAYLLGNDNREFTLSAYPTFWFYIPNNLNKVARLKFVITELETGKKIYDRVIKDTQKSAIVGIDLPQEKRYALAPAINYAWNLQVDCPGKNRKSEIALGGWLSRSGLNFQLKPQLAAVSEAEKYRVYLKHNLLYDALTEVAQNRIAEPNNIQVETAWNQLLTKLGWQDLIGEQSALNPSFNLSQTRNH
ncbi:MAG: DUF928 domain-containing protein [Pleurocapsa sp. SU_5_0]|nr:DUF928 domain-containing protein [Pleurocapsa sp. SU_5_0]NJR47531.1 DUF928 domain-containing protein [Hyellaceae cyanobacterium CSU_1_1]